MRAAQALSVEGIDASVVDVRSLVPLDVRGLVDAVEHTGRCVIVHEAPLTGGFGAEIAATISQQAFHALKRPIERVAGPDVPYPLAASEQMFIPTVERVVAVTRKMLEVQ
jgi:pyruvate dehydrogenase E1 component beta subunit